MADPYPTPTRLRLLRSVSRTDEVYAEAGQAYVHSTGARVGFRITEMLLAGWVREVPHTYLSGRTSYALTDVGRAVLAEADREKKS